MKRIYLAGGCFWGLEKYLSIIPGVLKTETGYANGLTKSPAYEDVSYRGSGHVETVLVEYDPNALSLSFLLELFYLAIDPTSVNRQGADEGTQYRTGVYYEDGDDAEIVGASLQTLSGRVNGRVVIESGKLENYYPAEDYHQKYLDKNPTGYCHIGVSQFGALERYLKEHHGKEPNNGFE